MRAQATVAPLIPLANIDDQRISRDADIIDPNATDSDGVPAVMWTDDERVALLLLRAGANPRVRDKDETLRQMAERIPWPATPALLDQQGIR